VKPGLQIEYLGNDEDVIELSVAASNGRFSGRARAYAGADFFKEIQERVSGFPVDAKDRREIEFGDFDAQASGAVTLRFFCKNRSGHAFIDVEIIAKREQFDGSESVRLMLPIEAGALDEFLAEVANLKEWGQRAVLLVRSEDAR